LILDSVSLAVPQLTGIPTRTMSEKALSHTSMDPEKHTIETSSLGSDAVAPVDPALEKVVWRKLDLWILPTVAMFYLLSFLVRRMSIFDKGSNSSHLGSD
jgi:hypothetical protein